MKEWFFREVFPHEAALTRYIRRNWRDTTELADIRQEIYLSLYACAGRELPRQARPFLFATARNHLINRVKRARIVSMEHVADLESLGAAIEEVTPVRHLLARDELRRLQAGLDLLPRRCREVVILKRVEGLSTRETAARLGITAGTVEQQMVHGMRALIDYMMGGDGRIRRAGSNDRDVRENNQ